MIRIGQIPYVTSQSKHLLQIRLCRSFTLLTENTPIVKCSKIVRLASAVTLMLAGIFSMPVHAQDDGLLKIVEEEISREMDALKKAEIPPYYIGYRINDIHFSFITSSFGSLISSHQERARILNTTVKVGDYQIDDSHDIEGGNLYREGGGYGNELILPVDNDATAIRQVLWRSTDNEYKRALGAYRDVKKALENPTEKKKSDIADFSKEKPSLFFEPPIADFNALMNKQQWEDKIKSYTAPFLGNKDIISCDASLQFTAERKYFVSSEGTRIAQNMTYANLNISASIRTDDDDIAPLYISYFAFTPDHLPSSEVILKDIQELIAKLVKLQKAPLAEPYSGPAILHARSAGVFFHEIFGHRVEGHRLKSEDDGQTFKAKVGETVLPKTLNVTFDPTIFNYKGNDLVGAYKYDDEGIQARRVSVVEKGILKSFLMSRTPLEEFAASNGHGRAAAGANPVSRQSNLLVESSKALSVEDLRKMLIKECQKQGKKYGYLFKEVTGGFTTTDRYSANVFNIMPTEVYRIYVDGRPDELVRGVDLIGTPLAMFAEIIAAGNDNEIFTGVCGAESGGVPVSAISPSLFVRRIETQKKPKMSVELPLLSRPGVQP
jgi:TldD protein